MKNFYEMMQILEGTNESSFNFETDNLEDLIAAIHRLPDTIKYINVTDRLCAFSPGQKKFDPRVDSQWREKAEAVLMDLRAKTPKEKWDEIDSMELRSYYGHGGATDPFYTRFSWPSEREFSQKMSDGHYGSLD